MSVEDKVGAPSVAAVDNQMLREASADTFEKISAYLLGELKSATEDYVLLEQMNALTGHKYGEMAGNAESLTAFMKQLREKCKTESFGNLSFHANRF